MHLEDNISIGHIKKFIAVMKKNGVQGPYYLETCAHKIYVFEKERTFIYGENDLTN